MGEEKTIKTQGENAGVEQQEKSNPSALKNWLAIVGSVALAFVIWLFVMATDSPTYVGEINEIPIRIQNDSGLSILSGDELTVDLKVEGKRSQIQSIPKEEIDVSVTVDRGTLPGRYTYELDVQLPAGLRLVESSMTKVMIYLDHTTSMSVPVSVKLAQYNLPDSYEIATEAEFITSVQSVKVTGPESLLQTIECAQVTLSLGNITETVTSIGSLTLVDRAGDPISSSYVKMAQKEVMVTIPVYKYRKLTLEVNYNQSLFDLKVEPATIKVRGEASKIDKITWSYTVSTEGTHKVLLPDGVTAAQGEPDHAMVTLTPIDRTVKQLTVNKYEIRNQKGRTFTSAMLVPIKVTVKGSESALAGLSEADVVLVLDLDALTNPKGVVDVAVKVILSDEYEGRVTVQGTYTVTVVFDQTAS